MPDKKYPVEISQSIYDEISKIAVRMNLPPEDLIAEALSGYIDLNEMQCREIEHRLNDRAQDRFAADSEMDALFGKYRNAH